MIKKKWLDESGVTLLEVLVTMAILTFLTSLTFGVLTTTVKYKDKTQSHVNLRQEANLIVSTLRNQHQQPNYAFCSENLLTNDQISFKELTITDTSATISKENPCADFKSSDDLNVQFTLTDKQNNSFDVDTVISGGKLNMASKDINVTLPSIDDGPGNFYDFLIAENVFVYGKQLEFAGGNMIGPNATMVILGNLSTNQLNGGAFSKVSNIFIDGNIDLEHGSAGLGSNTNPGFIYVNGDFLLKSGTRDIYGDVYVARNTFLKDANIRGNIYVQGDVTLNWTPNLSNNSRVFYKGSLNYPSSFDRGIIEKMIKDSNVPTVPNEKKLNFEIPPLKSDQWFTANGYSQTLKQNNMKLYGNTINVGPSINGQYVNTFNNVTLVSKGDIKVEGGDLRMTGVLFAPNGKVTFHGESFEGLVISKEGFFVTRGGSTVTFKNIEHYIKNVQDFPFQVN
ncbi:prepilin-type N-terminal cleavage/methylation domain-containing protein [Sutcliffiella halmapala]|uniref:prepilin-type N-terminal cleavage/methylation domain-containing protein n=1 Tax=Sutcliffiella halmapala TaxID=79882 RepID=UPI000994D79E|nr:prepilin-type N-terminal cleavage/methylation domain-containing protein [Sutcliffiella halmapala]